MTKTTYTLQMTSPSQLRPKRTTISALRIERVQLPCPEFSKFLHSIVGYDYRWGGRHHWKREDWEAHVRRDELETWVAYLDEMPAGYFELERQDDGSVRILCFGLLRPFIGRGLGGHLLTVAVERAWKWGAKRVWLRTCSHDHPHVLPNYLARGFTIVEKTEEPANP
ncbi:MAG: GNAT family N-acetyltransferase, partial [Candidatus Zipacnadales bacterium]